MSNSWRFSHSRLFCHQTTYLHYGQKIGPPRLDFAIKSLNQVNLLQPYFEKEEIHQIFLQDRIRSIQISLKNRRNPKASYALLAEIVRVFTSDSNTKNKKPESKISFRPYYNFGLFILRGVILPDKLVWKPAREKL